MSIGYLSTSIFLGGPTGPGLSAAFNPHLNPHLNPHHNPHHNPHANPHHGLPGFGPRFNPNPIGGQAGASGYDALGNGDPMSQRNSLSYDPATRSPWPWQGLNPPWTYDGGEAALLSQALRKVQARLVGERDVRRDKAEMGKIARPAGNANAIWRWQSEFRQQAVVGEMLGHTAVEDKAVYLLVRRARANGLTVAAQPLVQIAPPAIGFKYGTQIDKVLRAAVEREERLPEILSQAADFRPFFFSLTGLDRAPTRHTDELILVAWAWATHVLMMLKNNIAEYRPVQRSSLVMPIIATPGHGSLPSGHATIAAVTARILSALLAYKSGGPKEQLLHHLASRIAFNRVVAGVHFQMDSFVGQQLGASLADAFLAMAQENRPMTSATAPITVDQDSQWAEGSAAVVPKGNAVAAPVVPSLQKLWTAADREIQSLKI